MNKQTDIEWLPLDLAAQLWGYSSEGLRRRLRQLRQRGLVSDIGRPPGGYSQAEGKPVVIMWPNPQTALIHKDAPAEFLNSKKGRRKPCTKLP